MRDKEIKNEKVTENIIDDPDEAKERFLSGLKSLCIRCGVTDVATIRIQRDQQVIKSFVMKNKTFITTEDIMNKLCGNN